ncbi:MAG: hypothetical protein ABW217_17800 [Polyangiaceae bacterium]
MSLKDPQRRALAARQPNAGSCLAMGVAALFSLACQKSGAPSAERAEEPAGNKSGQGVVMPPAPTGDNVHCLGVHECKGKSECHVAGGHACVGQNECKGKGWISLPKQECLKKGGTVLDS